MKIQSKDKFYDHFLKEPTKDHFVEFVKANCGELNEIDFKEKWIEKGPLAKIILAMANSFGGIIVFGVKEEDDGSVTPIGLEKLKDKSEIDLGKLISPNLDYEIFDFSYDSPLYQQSNNMKFQMLVVNNTPERLPFVSLGETKGIEKDTIYVRRNTRCEKANESEIGNIIQAKLSKMYKTESSALTLAEHLRQLKFLYEEMPKKTRVLIRKGEPSPFIKTLALLEKTLGEELYRNAEYEEIDNPMYPSESYESFISRMIEMKKLRIERVLDVM